MDILSVLTLAGGLAFFLYGMTVLSDGLERMAGGKLEHLLKKITSNPFKSMLLGLVITAAIQSSSAVTVMLVGLVNSGIMNITQSVGIIMGSNIGTTMTAWILTLVGIESETIWMKLLKPENFSLIFAFVGVLYIMLSKNQKKRDLGSILIGFAVLMYGMKMMSEAVKPLSSMPSFAALFTAFKNPILGVLVGALFTALIQSSSASVGVLQALAMTGCISYGAAIPIIMGQNIGTCITALISSIGVSKNAKKVAVIHITFNLIGTAICLTAYCILDVTFTFAFADLPIGVIGIAGIHSIFNIFTTIMLIPFSKGLVRIANRIMRDSEEEATAPEILDRRLLSTPSVAVAECDSLTIKMAVLAKESLLKGIDATNHYNPDQGAEIMQTETLLDDYEDSLGTVLVQLSSKKLSVGDSSKISRMLHAIGNFERLGDYAVNLLDSGKELAEKQLAFSQEAYGEMSVLASAIREILELTTRAYEENDTKVAMQVEPLEQVIDSLVEQIKSRHIKRLQAGECSIEMGFILSDLLTSYERISDHCSNIAVSIIETAHSSFNTHRYLNSIKYGDAQFAQTFDNFSARYNLK